MRMSRWMVLGVSGLLLTWNVGCKNPDQVQIETMQGRIAELQTENQRLSEENQGLRERLARAISERDAAIARANSLQQQVNDLMSQLAAARAMPAPIEQPRSDGWERAGVYEWLPLDADFLFDSGRADLKSEGRARLQEVVSTLNSRYGDKQVWVLGHTDTDPIRATRNLWKDNLDLSANRAMTVYRELMNMGIRPERMIAGGQGEFFPRASNANRAGKAQNRRVEIIVVPPRPATGTSASAAPARESPSLSSE
ncbi:MAG: OmpA family protein [Phycisphaerales bacterium]|nr:OmpA family protein [Phycisphaerales bacterium]